MAMARRIAAVAAAGFLSSSGFAVAQEAGPYASIFGGINILHDDDFEIRPVDPGLVGFDALPASMFFKPGGAVGGAVGYRWGNFAAEGEVSLRRGRFEREELPFGTIQIDGRYDATSLMANAYYRFANNSPFTPYVGAGAGVAFLSASVQPDGAPSISLRDTRAAFQAIAGLSYSIGANAELGLEYRYFRTATPSYLVDIGGADANVDLDYKASNVLLRLNWKFN